MNGGKGGRVCAVSLVCLLLFAPVASPARAQDVPVVVAGDTVQAAELARAAAREQIVTGYFLAGVVAGPLAVGTGVAITGGADLRPWMIAGPLGMTVLARRATRSNPLPPDFAAQVATTDSAYAAVFTRTYDAAVRRRRVRALTSGALAGVTGVVLFILYGFNGYT
jgi:hypothetical protein